MIEYLEDEHLYLANGVIIPSVSRLVEFATGDDYSIIPSYILKNACDFGTDIHEAIQNYLEQGIKPEFTEPYRSLAFNEFLRLYKEFIDYPICEAMIDYKERYAGRIDCLNGDILIDFKTNTNLNIPHLEWQLGYYKLALEEQGYEVNKCKCLWLPKRKSGKWVDINPKSKEECLRNLKEYEEFDSN